MRQSNPRVLPHPVSNYRPFLLDTGIPTSGPTPFDLKICGLGTRISMQMSMNGGPLTQWRAERVLNLSTNCDWSKQFEKMNSGSFWKCS